MLSDHPDMKNRTLKRRKVKDVGKWYSDSQKIECLKLWLVTGNLRTVAGTMDIPYDTLWKWKASKWWEEASQEFRQENRIQLSAKLQKIAEKALDETVDRLENGDYVISKKTGNIIRKPVAMRDAYLVAAGMLDRKERIDARPQEEMNQQTQDRLANLAKTFAELSKKVKRIEVIDATYTDSPNSSTEGQRGERTQTDGSQTLEQDGDNEGEFIDLEGKEKECDDSLPESEGQSSEILGESTQSVLLQP